MTGIPVPPPFNPANTKAPPAPRPAINPLEFRAGDLQGNDLGAAPFANQNMSVEEFGVRWWFQYFWQEAKMVATQQDREAMAAICTRLFIKTPRGPFAYECRPAFKNDDFTTSQPDVWRGFLTTLLHIGFRRVDPKQAVQSGNNGPPVPQVAAHHLMLRADLAPHLPQKFTPDTDIFWRAESRTMERIVQQQGTKRQSDVEFLANEMQISAPWHPYSDPDINKYMWYRSGQNDNDYYTVISVAVNFETALSFPKIDEKRVYGFPKKPLEEWTRDEVRLHQKNMALVTLVDGSERIMLATQTTAYMCVACGRIIDTMTAGGGFPEKGVSEIPLDQIFAMLPVTRVHHGPDPLDGFTAFIDHNKGRIVQEDIGKAMDLFGEAYPKCKDEYFRQKYRGKVESAWAANGFQAPRVPVSISRLIEFPASGQKLQAFIAARPAAAMTAADFIKAAGGNVQGVLRKRP
jgi:hypothetical protein